MATAAVIFLVGLALILAGWKLAPKVQEHLQQQHEKRLREEAAAQFIGILTPIRDRIAVERSNHRNAWIASRMEITNACSLLGPHLDDATVSRLEAAYMRFNNLREKDLEPKRVNMPASSEGFIQDYASVKEALLEPIREMVQIAQQVSQLIDRSHTS